MRSALVTGASTGIGRATALWLDSRGWRVYAGVRREEDATLTRRGRVRPAAAADPRRHQRRADRGRGAAHLRGDRGAGLDGLVNNAGIAVPGPLETLPIEDFRRQIEVNLTAQVAVTKAMLPSIRAARGRIVFITSIGGLMAIQMFGAYHAAKFGLEAVGDVFRQELAPWGIRVSIIEPGSIATPIWERGVGEADALLERATEEEKALYPNYIASYQKLARGGRGARDPAREGRGDDRAGPDRRPPSDPLPGRHRRPRPGAHGPLPARPALDRLISLFTGI